MGRTDVAICLNKRRLKEYQTNYREAEKSQCINKKIIF